jgi:predicted nucleotidyltransferase
MKDSILVQFLEGIKDSRGKINKLYLFGSRARGDHKPYSDYDILLVASNDFTLEDKDKLYDSVMDVLLKTGKVISLKIYKEKNFEQLRRIGAPFMQNVLREGVPIG